MYLYSLGGEGERTEESGVPFENSPVGQGRQRGTQFRLYKSIYLYIYIYIYIRMHMHVYSLGGEGERTGS